MLVVPVVVLLLTTGMQAAVWFHAAHVAQAAAAEGAAAGAALGGDPGTATAAATRLAGELRGTLASRPTAVLGDDSITVTVTVQVPRVAPFFPRTVRRSVVEPRERTTTEAER